jgi:hypothetical protein
MLAMAEQVIGNAVVLDREVLPTLWRETRHPKAPGPGRVSGRPRPQGLT